MVWFTFAALPLAGLGIMISHDNEEGALAVFLNSPDLVVAQSIFRGEVGERIAVIAIDAVAVTSEPMVILLVLKNTPDALAQF